MQLTCLSWLPQRPCLLLQLPTACVLLDCAVDLSSLSSFLPLTISNNARFMNLPSLRSTLKYLKKCKDLVFVDGPLEVHAVPVRAMQMQSIDVILVSNWMSLFALPFFTEGTGFRGSVYATDPTFQLGRLVMEECLEFVDRVDKDPIDKAWTAPDVFTTFVNKPSSNPREWTPFYSRQQMDSALSRVQCISFRESVGINDATTIAAYSSGYSVGSCNWVVRGEHEKIVFLSAASSRNSHTKAVHWDQLRNSNVLILTSVCRFPEHSPENSVLNVVEVVAETLKRNGSVLLPVCPTGILYDLLEVIISQMDQHCLSVDIPVYFISPVAESVLAYSNIYAEWLSEKKQNKVYVPEDPFDHDQWRRFGRLKVFDNIHGDFCRQMRTPCVVLTGHPSLRMGDAVHFLEMWANDSKNAVIMTDPDYPLQEVYGPYEKLSIRAFFYPIDTRLDFSQLNLSIIPDLAPRFFFMPTAYAQPPSSTPASQRDCVVKHNNAFMFRYGETVTIPSLAKRKRVRLHPELLRQIELRPKSGHLEVGLSPLRGYLSAYDNVLQLNPDFVPTKKSEPPPSVLRPDFVRGVSYTAVLRALAKKGLEATQEQSESGFVFTMPQVSAVLRIDKDAKKSIISCSSAAVRRLIADALASCLTPL